MKRADWALHLVRWRGGRSSLERVGPHGGYVNAAGFEHVTCPTCGNVAVWPPGVQDVVCVPPGHYLIRDDDGQVVEDICPEV